MLQRDCSGVILDDTRVYKFQIIFEMHTLKSFMFIECNELAKECIARRAWCMLNGKVANQVASAVHLVN